ncbi:MAG: S9 family peptidase [Terriglobales bacterium]
MSCRSSLFVLALCSTVVGQQTAPKTFSVRDIFAEPGLTGPAPETIEWSPDGKRLTFLERARGNKLANLYEIDPDSSRRSVLVPGAVLAGAAESLDKLTNEREKERRARYGVASYHWSPSGRQIIYSSNNQLYSFDIATQKAVQLTNEPGDKRDPKLSPDERWISYVTDGDLRFAAVSHGKPRAVAEHADQILNGDLDWVYPEELSTRTGYEWSPGSDRLAFLRFDEHPVHSYPIEDFIPHFGSVDEEKYPKAGDPNPIVTLGIYSLKNHKTVWVPVGGTPDSYIPRFGWLPDGHTLYAMVLNRAQSEEQIVLADASSGKTRVLLTETNPYWISEKGRDDLHFFKSGDKFLWGSDRDGFHHLYLFDMQGKLLRQLTHGHWHVNGLEGVDEAAGWVYYAAAARTPLETDLYRVSVNGGDPQRLTQGNGSHAVNLAPDQRHYLDTFSDSLHPPQLSVVSLSGGGRHVLQPAADLSAYGLQAPEFFQIPAADGTSQLWAWILKPPGFDPSRKYPVIMSQYGGPQAQTVSNAWGGPTFLFYQLLARQGFVIFDTDNRAASYFDRATQALIQGHFGTIELADQLAAVKWLKAQPWVDAGRLGIWGWSYGGYMTTYELTHAPGVWKAGIAVAPVTQWTDYDTIYTERYMGMPQTNAAGYRESSSLTHADQLRDHLLLVHGTGDDNVHFQNSVQFIQALIDADKHFQLMIYPRKTHGIGGPAARTHLFEMMDSFWERWLGAGS